MRQDAKVSLLIMELESNVASSTIHHKEATNVSLAPALDYATIAACNQLLFCRWQANNQTRFTFASANIGKFIEGIHISNGQMGTGAHKVAILLFSMAQRIGLANLAPTCEQNYVYLCDKTNCLHFSFNFHNL